MSDAATEMPKYRCHKDVWALKIAEIELVWNEATLGQLKMARLTPLNKKYGIIEVDREYILRVTPKNKPFQDLAGGYYVVYKDGYKSWSPAVAFEDGYSLIDEDHTWSKP